MGADVTRNSEIFNLRSFYQLRGEQLVYFLGQVKVHDSYLLVSVRKCQKHQELGHSFLKSLHMGFNQLNEGNHSILSNQSWSAEERETSSST